MNYKYLPEDSGYFIVLEGLDGSGTTTQARNLVLYLSEQSKANIPILTNEPTSLNPSGKEIRRRLEDKLLPGEKEIHDHYYWTNLFIEDRRWHLEHVVEPNVNRGLHVISDRHRLSTFAYQTAQGANMVDLIHKHRGLFNPDLTLFLDVPVEVALARRGRDSSNPEYFEKKEMQEKVALNYHKAIGLIGDEQNVVIIDGTKSPEEVALDIQAEVDKLFLDED